MNISNKVDEKGWKLLEFIQKLYPPSKLKPHFESLTSFSCGTYFLTMASVVGEYLLIKNV